MANTVAGALKAYIETLGLGITCFRDRATPATLKRPYITINEEVSNTAYPVAGRTRQLAQVDVWFDSGNENVKLVDDLIASLTKHGAGSYGTPSRRLYALSFEGKVRLVEENDSVIHHAITVAVPRAL